MTPLCDLPDDWNPNKAPRAEFISQGYVLFEWCRSGRSHYETWMLQGPGRPKYHVVHYRWCNEGGWVPTVQSFPLTSDRDDLMVRNPMLTKIVLSYDLE